MNAEDRTVAGAVRLVIPDVARAVDLVAESFRRGGGLSTWARARAGVSVSWTLRNVRRPSASARNGDRCDRRRARHRFSLARGVEDDVEAAERDIVAQGVTVADTVVGITASAGRVCDPRARNGAAPRAKTVFLTATTRWTSLWMSRSMSS